MSSLLRIWPQSSCTHSAGTRQVADDSHQNHLFTFTSSQQWNLPSFGKDFHFLPTSNTTPTKLYLDTEQPNPSKRKRRPSHRTETPPTGKEIQLSPGKLTSRKKRRSTERVDRQEEKTNSKRTSTERRDEATARETHQASGLNPCSTVSSSAPNAFLLSSIIFIP